MDRWMTALILPSIRATFKLLILDISRRMAAFVPANGRIAVEVYRCHR